jgi:AraC-like DNA-binding protein
MDFQNLPVFPRVCVSATRAMYVGPGLSLDPHANAATTIAIALTGSMQIRFCDEKGGWSDWIEGSSQIITSGKLHHLKSNGVMAFLYVDPFTTGHADLAALDLNASRSKLKTLYPALHLDDAFGAFNLKQRNISDQRILKIIKEIDTDPQRFSNIKSAAESAFLSPSRFRDRFLDEVGLPYGRYRTWKRMAHVMKHLSNGKNITYAASSVGFSTPSHFSASFKKMFGISAREIIALNAKIEIVSDFQ